MVELVVGFFCEAECAVNRGGFWGSIDIFMGDVVVVVAENEVLWAVELFPGGKDGFGVFPGDGFFRDGFFRESAVVDIIPVDDISEKDAPVEVALVVVGDGIF